MRAKKSYTHYLKIRSYLNVTRAYYLVVDSKYGQ